MIEANNPEINVDELMEKIREEVAKRHGYSQPASLKTQPDISKIMTATSYIENLLKNAESRAYVRTKWPDKLNRFPFKLPPKLQKIILKFINFLFKDQREVNFNLINSVKESVALNRQMIEQITSLRAQVEERQGTIDSSIQGLNQRLNTIDNRVQGLDERLNTIDNRVQGLDERLNTIDSRFQGLDERLDNIDSCFQGLDERLNTIDSRFQGLDERLDNIDSRFQGLDERLDNIDNTIQGIDDSFNTIDSLISNWLTDIQQRLDAVNNQGKELEQHLSAMDTRIRGIDERYLKNDSYLKNDLMQQKRLITIFLEEAHKHLPKTFSQDHLQTFVKEEEHLLDAFYVAFEDEFRGSREDILKRLKVYLPLLKEANLGTPDSPILDVGCGRGEWLELLRDSGYTAKGLDINRVMLQQCQTRGLEVIEADVIAYLQALPDGSLGAVTGFHIIEHLSFSALIKLVDETLRVLHSSGLVIFESPNPENIVVGACNFYSDLTHRNPLFPPTVKFLLQQRGFSDVQLLRLREYRLEDPLQFIEADNPIAAKVNPLIEIAKSNFYASPDFAVIAKKA